MTQYELESRWITEEGVPGVVHRFSDLVQIKSGDYSGGDLIYLLLTIYY
jgi:hypothetical protein